MKLKSSIYLAARYSRREEMIGYAGQLEALGYDVDAEWVWKGHDKPKDCSEDREHEFYAYAALHDYHDIYNARTLICFTEAASDPNGNGGKDVELGIALGMENGIVKREIILIGPRRTVFHYLAIVKQFDTWQDFLREIIRA